MTTMTYAYMRGIPNDTVVWAHNKYNVRSLLGTDYYNTWGRPLTVQQGAQGTFLMTPDAGSFLCSVQLWNSLDPHSTPPVQAVIEALETK